MKRKIVSTLMVILVAGVVSTAYAVSSYRTTFNNTYGTSATVLNSCVLCHPAGGGNTASNLNNYAKDYSNSGSFLAIEGLDSDGDGFTNLAEITARTFPGDAASHPAAADATLPIVTAFVVPPTAASLIVPITTFTATDNVGVTGYMITESAAVPPAASTSWSGTARTSYTFSSPGAKTLYAWAKDAAGNVSAPAIAATTVAATTAANQEILWKNTSGQVSLWNLDALDNYVSEKNYGPFPGWTPIGYHEKLDGTGKFLWVNASTGQARLWITDSLRNMTSFNDFGPFPGWTPIGYRGKPDGTGRLLWKNTSGQASLWKLDSTDNYAGEKNYGPLPGWTPIGYREKLDGTGRLLWQNASGQASLWKLDVTDNYLSEKNYGPYAGWSLIGYREKLDGTGRLLWQNASGQASLWKLDVTDNYLSEKNYGPYAGWSLIGYREKPDGTGSLFWQNASGQASLWKLDATNNYLSEKNYGPFTGWTPVSYE